MRWLVGIASALMLSWCPSACAAGGTVQGFQKGQQFINQYASPSNFNASTIQQKITNNMPASSQMLGAASDGSRQIATNPQTMQDNQSNQWSNNMMTKTNSATGTCHIMEDRQYCESAIWHTTKSKNSVINLGQSAAPLPATLATCRQKMTPPAGYTNRDLISASVGAHTFTGTVTCKSSTSGGANSTKVFNVALNGSAFIGVQNRVRYYSYTSSSKSISQTTIVNKCKVYRGWRNGVPPNGVSYVNGWVNAIR